MASGRRAAVDYSQPVELQYGVHTLTVTADGYDTYSKKAVCEFTGGNDRHRNDRRIRKARRLRPEVRRSHRRQTAVHPQESADGQAGSLAGSLAGSHSGSSSSGSSSSSSSGSSSTSTGTSDTTSDAALDAIVNEILDKNGDSSSSSSNSSSTSDYLSTLYVPAQCA